MGPFLFPCHLHSLLAMPFYSLKKMHHLVLEDPGLADIVFCHQHMAVLVLHSCAHHQTGLPLIEDPWCYPRVESANSSVRPSTCSFDPRICFRDTRASASLVVERFPTKVKGTENAVLVEISQEDY